GLDGAFEAARDRTMGAMRDVGATESRASIMAGTGWDGWDKSGDQCEGRFGAGGRARSVRETSGRSGAQSDERTRGHARTTATEKPNMEDCCGWLAATCMDPGIFKYLSRGGLQRPVHNRDWAPHPTHCGRPATVPPYLVATRGFYHDVNLALNMGFSALLAGAADASALRRAGAAASTEPALGPLPCSIGRSRPKDCEPG
ncbi:MAG: hypothetical protein RL153_1733, partial [Verrucomicrobiota bacterium]